MNTLSLFIAYSNWSVAVPTKWRHSLRSFAFRQAVWTPKFIGMTSSAITRSQVKLGLPGGRFQDGGGFCIAAQTVRRWSSVDCTRAMWPKKRNLLARTVSETGRHCVTFLISALVTCFVEYSIWIYQSTKSKTKCRIITDQGRKTNIVSSLQELTDA